MAQIRIEEKRRSMTWLWALIALALVALVAWFLLANGRTTVGSEGATPGDTLPMQDTSRTSLVEPASPAPLYHTTRAA